MNKLITLFVVIIIACTGCSHDQFKPIGGKGGSATLVVYPKHHDEAISLDSVMVYIKYNTLDAPANGKYDDSAACTFVNLLWTCSFSTLWNGDYYIYTRAYDNNIAARVKGGLPYTIKSQQSQSIILPVGEESGF